MMKGFKYTCFSVLSLALLSACSMNQSSELVWTIQTTMNTTTNKNPLVGKDAGNFELKGYEGEYGQTFPDYKGRALFEILGNLVTLAVKKYARIKRIG